MNFHEEAFEGTVEIVAAAMEEAEVDLSAEGGEQVAEFFTAIYKRLRSLATGEEEKSSRSGSFEVYEDAKGEYRFRLKAANGQTIAASEGYKTLDSCLNGVESVRNNAKDAKLKQL
ncbi:MAG: DUF1508 domain-containing protein [Oscillospiraceae bacterium]|nr:DUF1508 domain-containing protein [Oscillospiraceae bacterium]